MTEEPKRKKPARDVGSLREQWNHFGSDDEEGSDVLTAKLQKGKTATSQDVLQSSSHDILTAKGQEGKIVTSQNVKDATRQEEETASGQNVKKPKIPDTIKQQTVYLPKALAHWLKVHAAITEQDLSEIITKLVEEYKAKQEDK